MRLPRNKRRQNTAPTVQKTGSGWQFRKPPKHAMRGVPDIILIHSGQFTGLEVKTETDRLSADQVVLARKAEAAGARYHVVRSIDDVVRISL